MSSSLLLRSAINATSAAARRSCRRPPLLIPKASISALSFPSSSSCDDARFQFHDSVDLVAASAVAAPIVTANALYRDIASRLSDMIISGCLAGGDSTLVTVDEMARRLEEEEEGGGWEDVITTEEEAMESPLLPTTTGLLSELLSIWQISTLKRRRKKMNKHKLRKRKKKMRLKTRK